MTIDSVGRKLAWHRPFVYYVTRDVCVMWKGASSSVEKEMEKKRLSDRARKGTTPQTHTHTASYGSRRTRSLQALKHTHPAGLLFQSNLLVDAARTFTKFFLASHNSPLVSTCHAERSKSALLIALCRSCCCFLVARGTKSNQKVFEIVEK